MDKKFLIELKERFVLPWKSSAFVSYFIWIVFLFGGISIAMTIWQEFSNDVFNFNNLSKSIGTTFMGLIAASLVDLNLNYNIKNIPSFTINSYGIAGLCVLLFIISFNSEGIAGVIFSFVGYLFALGIWVLANADNDKLNDENFFYKSMRGKGSHGSNWDK
jgi:hypothetical protein